MEHTQVAAHILSVIAPKIRKAHDHQITIAETGLQTLSIISDKDPTQDSDGNGIGFDDPDVLEFFYYNPDTKTLSYSMTYQGVSKNLTLGTNIHPLSTSHNKVFEQETGSKMIKIQFNVSKDSSMLTSEQAVISPHLQHQSILVVAASFMR